MPVHDWLRPDAGIFHHFHQSWTVNLAEGLNAGVLPSGFFALVDQRAIGLVPDALALKKNHKEPSPSRSGATLLSTPPRLRFISQQSDREVYASLANRVAIRNAMGELVAIIEIVSPGNKDSIRALDAFVNKAVESLARGVSLLVTDLFPPTPREPQGIRKQIWDELTAEDFALPQDKPLTLAAYEAGMPITAYVEPIAASDALPAMPLYLEPGRYLPTPLEETYQRTWERCPAEMKAVVEQ